MLSFKYYPPDPIPFALVRNGELFFAAADELNDSNELRPRFVFKGDRELWGRLFEYLLTHSAFLCENGYDLGGGRKELVINLADNLSAKFHKRHGRRDVRLEDLAGLIKGEVVTANFGDMDSRLIASNLERFLSRDFLEVLRPREFIASFSVSGANPMMWGHYAKAGKGFSVVYETPNSTLGVSSDMALYHGVRDENGNVSSSDRRGGILTIGTWNDAAIELKKVRYAKRDVKVNAFRSLTPHFFYSEEEDHYDVPLMIGSGAPEKGEDYIGLVKDKRWSFEYEIRASLPLFSEKNEFVPTAKRIARVDLSHFRGVILGPNISEDDKRNLVASVRSLILSRTARGDGRAITHRIVVLRATRDSDSFSYHIEPYLVISGKDGLIGLSRNDSPESRLLNRDAWELADQINERSRLLRR